MNRFAFIGTAIEAFGKYGKKLALWGGGLLGVEAVTSNNDGKGGVFTKPIRSVVDAAITESSAGQARNLLWDYTAGASATVNAFLGGTLKTLCDFLAHMGFEPARGWSEGLAKFRDGQEKEIQALRVRSRANSGGSDNDGGVISSITTGVSNVATNNPELLATGGAVAAASLAAKGLKGTYNPLSLIAGSPKKTTAIPPVTPNGPHGGNPAGGTRSQNINASKYADGLGNHTPATAAATSAASAAAHAEVKPGIMSKLATGAKRSVAGAAIVGGATFVGNIVMGSSTAEAAETTAKTIVPFADAVEKASAGNAEGAKKSAVVEAGGLAGFFAGAAAGGTAGATLGTVAPGLGNLVGGVVGGLAGGIAGSIGGSAAVEAMWDNADAIKGSISSLFTSKAAETAPASVAVQTPNVTAFKAAVANSPIVVAPKLVEVPQYDIMGNPTGMGPAEPKPLTFGLN